MFTVRGVIDRGHILDQPGFHSVGGPFRDRVAQHAIGDLSDHDGALAAAPFFDVTSPAKGDAPTTGAIGVDNATAAADLPPRREVRTGQSLHQLRERCLGIVQMFKERVAHLTNIVRRQVRSHPDRDASGSVDQQVGEPGRQHGGLAARVIVVGDEVHGVKLDIFEHDRGGARHPGLGVPHGRRRIAVD